MYYDNHFLFSALQRKQKEDAEESEAKKSRLIPYMNEDDDGKEVKHDIEKERKRKDRLVFSDVRKSVLVE
jgi:hypothetical protein